MMRSESLRGDTWPRFSLLSWLLTSALLLAFFFDPVAASATTPLRFPGALQRDGGVGIVAHRGAAAVAPENTLAAFRVAIAQGVEFVETDVQLTADGVPVLMHDPTVDRTTNGSGPIAEHTFEELRALDAGSWFGAEFAGERVPTLQEFVELLRTAPLRAFVELKGEWSDESVAAIVQLLREHQLMHRFVIATFERDVLELFRERGAEFATILLTRDLSDETVHYAAALGVSAVCARKKLIAAHPEAVAAIRAAGMGAIAYTLNTEQQWRGAEKLGVDFFVTDDPIALAQWRLARDHSSPVLK